VINVVIANIKKKNVKKKMIKSKNSGSFFSAKNSSVRAVFLTNSLNELLLLAVMKKHGKNHDMFISNRDHYNSQVD
jgi:hypothetical protein